MRVLTADLRQALGIRSLSVRILFSSRDVDGEAICASPWLGYYYDERIYLRPGLRGNTLYTIALHEIGHHLGLDHYSSGIMATAPTVTAGRLTKSWRKTCLRSFARALVRKRLAAL